MVLLPYLQPFNDFSPWLVQSQDWSLAVHHGVCQPCPVGAICHLISLEMDEEKPQAIHVNRENDEWLTGFGVHEIFRSKASGERWSKPLMADFFGRTGWWSESNMGRLTKQYEGMAGMAKGLFKASEAQILALEKHHGWWENHLISQSLPYSPKTMGDWPKIVI